MKLEREEAPVPISLVYLVSRLPCSLVGNLNWPANKRKPTS